MNPVHTCIHPRPYNPHLSTIIGVSSLTDVKPISVTTEVAATEISDVDVKTEKGCSSYSSNSCCSEVVLCAAETRSSDDHDLSIIKVKEEEVKQECEKQTDEEQQPQIPQMDLKYAYANGDGDEELALGGPLWNYLDTIAQSADSVSLVYNTIGAYAPQITS